MPATPGDVRQTPSRRPAQTQRPQVCACVGTLAGSHSAGAGVDKMHTRTHTRTHTPSGARAAVPSQRTSGHGQRPQHPWRRGSRRTVPPAPGRPHKGPLSAGVARAPLNRLSWQGCSSWGRKLAAPSAHPGTPLLQGLLPSPADLGVLSSLATSPPGSLGLTGPQGTAGACRERERCSEACSLRQTSVLCDSPSLGLLVHKVRSGRQLPARQVAG